MAALADRLILDSAGAAGDCETSLRGIANLLEGCVLAVGDLQWAALSPWRSLIVDLFTLRERAGELLKVRHLEILHGPNGECQALLLAGWLSAALGWRPESSEERTRESRVFRFSGPSGDVTVELVQGAFGTALHRLRLLTEELAFQIQASHRGKHADICSTVMRGDELLSERTVYLRSSDPSVLLGEEFEILGRDETYESALERVTEMLSL
jgi:glucose-6-phosphate dehydrogenase assembly protein OpcA